MSDLNSMIGVTLIWLSIWLGTLYLLYRDEVQAWARRNIWSDKS